MSDIGPGDFVECVDIAERPGELQTDVLILGAIYRVEQLILVTLPDYGPAVFLVEHPENGPHGLRRCFAPSRFRPIYRPKSEIIEGLKAPAPELEPA